MKSIRKGTVGLFFCLILFVSALVHGADKPVRLVFDMKEAITRDGVLLYPLSETCVTKLEASGEGGMWTAEFDAGYETRKILFTPEDASLQFSTFNLKRTLTDTHAPVQSGGKMYVSVAFINALFNADVMYQNRLRTDALDFTQTHLTGGISVQIDDEPLISEVHPQVISDRTMVPFKALFNQIGGEVQWLGETQSIVAKRSGSELRLQIGNKQAVLDGKVMTMDVPPMVIDDRTMIPLSFVAQCFGATVNYHSQVQVANIVMPGRPSTLDTVVFKDPGLEKIVRKAVKKPDGSLRGVDLLPMTLLTNMTEEGTLRNRFENITSLEGLQYAVCLKELNISEASVSDLKPVTTLSSLKYLLCQGNQIRDLSCLTAMENLRELDISRNMVESLEPLRSVNTLLFLWANENRISDISPLGKIPYLIRINLSGNMVSDLSPVTGMHELDFLNISRNNVKELQALSDFGDSGAYKLNHGNQKAILYLGGNPLSEASLKLLKDKKLEGIDTDAQATDANSEKIRTLQKFEDELLKTVIQPGMTDYTKVMAIHDAIIRKGTYNVAAYNQMKNNQPLADTDADAHWAYGILVQQKGVCDSYAEAFRDLCLKAGVPCEIVLGYGDGDHSGIDKNWTYVRNHAWNRVLVGGKWYMVDCTWDDQGTYPEDSRVDYSYFLKSAATFSQGHQWRSRTDESLEDYHQ